MRTKINEMKKRGRKFLVKEGEVRIYRHVRKEENGKKENEKEIEIRSKKKKAIQTKIKEMN